MKWPLVKVADICNQIRGVSYKKDQISDLPKEGVTKLYRSNNISSDGSLNENKLVFVSESCISDKQLLQQGDVFMTASTGSKSAIGKNVQIHEADKVTFGAFCKVLRPLSGKVDFKYFGYFFKRAEFRNYISNVVEGANINNLKNEHIDSLEIPLPPMPIQKQIAAVLEKADKLRQQSQQMEQELNSLAQSVFLDMFGDPILNPKKFTQKRLEEVVSVQSGATPSKARDDFWDGDYPWVSPKDMKRVYIDDSIDHVSSQAFKETNLKKIEEGSLLVVVRGMILAHTVPIATNVRKVAINQDIKALKVELDGILSKFLLWNIKVQHDNILSKVSTAAHGTKRLDMPDLMGISILMPSVEQQKKFVNALEKVDSLIKAAEQSKLRNEEIYSSLMQRAFKDELDLKDVA